MLSVATRSLLLLCVTIFSGCAANQTPSPVQPVTSVKTSTILVLRDDVVVRAPHTKKTILKQGTTWKTIGTVAQGTVLKTSDQVVIVNSFDVHEAQIVVRDDQVVGYYLPYAETFVAAKPIAIHLVEKGVPR